MRIKVFSTQLSFVRTKTPNIVTQHEVDKFKGAHEEISLRLFKQGKEPKGKKILVHPLRVLGTTANLKCTPS